MTFTVNGEDNSTLGAQPREKMVINKYFLPCLKNKYRDSCLLTIAYSVTSNMFSRYVRIFVKGTHYKIRIFAKVRLERKN